MRTVRIMIVDDHEVVRVGLRALLERRPDFRVVAEAGSADEAVQKAMDHRPDVIVMDIRLPGGNGIEATRKIVEALPETRVIMLTSYAEDELLLEAIEAGASGYVLKQIGSDELITAIERVARGEGPDRSFDDATPASTCAGGAAQRHGIRLQGSHRAGVAGAGVNR